MAAFLGLWLLVALLTPDLLSSFPVSPERMDLWLKRLEAELEKLTKGDNDVTMATQFSNVYQSAFDEGVGYTIETPNGESILSSMVDKISDIFDKNIQALEDLHQSAEQAVKDYKYKDDLDLRDVDYTNVNEMDGLLNETEYSTHFKQNIYKANSGVQIPIEIYEGYPNILNTIAWTQMLDATFKANAKRYPGVYWQTFGSQDGVLRVYPASQWQTVDNLPDLFDVRRRPWYITGTSSPKDVIILLDTSGSMHGQSFDIMKIAAKTLLNTLGENDYVNVAGFTENATWVTACLGDGLVQANARNKRLLFDGIDQLQDRAIAYFGKALEFAYEKLENFEPTRESDQNGADCHKLIMILSDGGTENPEKILEVYTNSSRGMTANARIFTYAVGPHPLPTVALKDMACATGGAFTSIISMGAIRTKVQDYIRILNRPLVLSKYRNFVKTSFFSRDHLGLGFVTTITMPVFNTSMESDNQTLAGVVGIDIPVSRFEAFAPKSHLGPLGYPFAINTNGFLIFHPNLWMIANYLEDPAHNDLEEVEGDASEIIEIRKAMIDMAADGDNSMKNISIRSSVILNLGHSASLDLEYFYASIPKTRFSLAIAVPTFWRYVKVPEQLDPGKTLKKMLKEPRLKLAARKYCDETKADGDSEFEGLEDLKKKLSNDSCHGRDLQHLIWDFKTLMGPWSSQSLDKKFKMRFALSDGGTILTEENANNYEKTRRSLLSLDPYNSSLYKMAVLSRTPVVYIEKTTDRTIIPIYIHSSEPDFYDEEGLNTVVGDSEATTSSTTTTPSPKLVMQMRPPSLYLAQSIRINDGQDEATVGVSGVEIKPDFLHDLVLNATHVDEISAEDCRNNEILACYLIDTSGYLLASNQDEAAAGDFLGVVDPQIMAHYLEQDLFQSRIEYNYQALCPTEINCESDGVGDLPRIFVWSLGKVMLGLLQQLSQGVFSLLAMSTALVGTSSAASEYTKQVTEGLHRCTTKTEHWEWKSSTMESSNHRADVDVSCQGNHCVREVHTFRLKNLNGIFILADPPHLCGHCKPPLIFDGPLEVPSSEECLLPPRYRRRPEDCFATHDDEVYECRASGSGNNNPHSLSHFSQLMMLFILLCLPG